MGCPLGWPKGQSDMGCNGTLKRGAPRMSGQQARRQSPRRTSPPGAPTLRGLALQGSCPFHAPVNVGGGAPQRIQVQKLLETLANHLSLHLV